MRSPSYRKKNDENSAMKKPARMWVSVVADLGDAGEDRGVAGLDRLLGLVDPVLDLGVAEVERPGLGPVLDLGDALDDIGLQVGRLGRELLADQRQHAEERRQHDEHDDEGRGSRGMPWASSQSTAPTVRAVPSTAIAIGTVISEK